MNHDPMVSAELRDRGVTRLVHFTSGRNFNAILRSGEIRTRAQLDAEAPSSFVPTDKERWDGFRGHTCCSIEYPNAYYFKVARDRDRNYDGWVCLLLDPSLAAREHTQFSPVNAATDNGAHAHTGVDALRAAYGPVIEDVTRTPEHLACCPTHLQAEVLVPGPISLASHLRGIVVPTGDDARRLRRRLRLSMGDDSFASGYPWIAAPEFFDADGLVAAIGSGRRVSETTIH